MSFKALLYRCGVLSAYHRFVNRRRLTVVMLHRVLRSDDPRLAWSDPGYTLAAEPFRQLLRFLKRHYQPVALNDLARPESLPPCPVLVTFDDGWADNVDTALPILQQEGVPATMFVAAGHIGAVLPFWQELLHGILQNGALPKGALDAVPMPRGEKPGEDIYRTILALTALPAETRTSILTPIFEAAAWPGRAMCTAEELRAWAQAGMSLGTHGMSHEPLDQVPSAGSESTNAKRALAAAVGQPEDSIVSMSFPHGRYTPTAAREVAGAGYALLFTSDRHLNPLDDAPASPAMLGRVYITEKFVADRTGMIRPELLATWLFTQPAKA